MAKAVDYAELFIYDEAHKRLPSVTLPSWGANASSYALAIPAKPPAAVGQSGLPKRYGQCPTSFGIRSARQPLLPQELPHLVQTLLIDDLPLRPNLTHHPQGEPQAEP